MNIPLIGKSNGHKVKPNAVITIVLGANQEVIINATSKNMVTNLGLLQVAIASMTNKKQPSQETQTNGETKQG